MPAQEHQPQSAETRVVDQAEQASGVSWYRQYLAAASCLIVAAVCLAIWYLFESRLIHAWYSDLNFFFAPLLIGVSVGCVGRWCSREGTFGLASFAAFITIAASFAGALMQHKLTTDLVLRRIADLAYQETTDYAKAVVRTHNDQELRAAMTGNGVAVVGRLALGAKDEPLMDYWQKRNLLHVNWIMARHIITYEYGGTEATILNSTRIIQGVTFVDESVAKLLKEPVADKEIRELKEKELSHLQELFEGRPSLPEYEVWMAKLVWSRMDWKLFLYEGFGFFLGFFTFVGTVAAFKLVRQHSGIEDL